MEFQLAKKILFSCLMLLLCYSCSDKSHFAFETKEIDFVNKTDSVIEGTQLDIEVMGLNDIMIIDSLLMFTTSNPKGQLLVYNLNTLAPIANLCLQGRASNEFFNPWFVAKQVYYNDDNDIIVPLIDNKSFIKEVDVTKSISNNKTIVLSRDNCMSVINGCFALIDNNVNKRFEMLKAQYDDVLDNVCYPPKYYFKENNIITEELSVFPQIMRYQDCFDVHAKYQGVFSKHPSKNIIIQPLQKMDYILFFDLDNEDFFAIHQKGTESFDDFVEHINPRDSIIHFGNVACSEKFFMIFYLAGEYSVNATDYEHTKAELLFFDWQGNYLTGVKMGVPIHRIAYDQKHHILYGADIDEGKLYSFDIEDILKNYE